MIRIPRPRLLAALTTLGLLCLTPSVRADESTAEPSEVVRGEPKGRLFRALFGDHLEREHGIIVHGWVQGGWAENFNDTENLLPQGFFTTENEFSLNEVILAVERPIRTNVIPRVTPLPGPKPEKTNVGFTFNAAYGTDGRFWMVEGIDDNFGENRGKREPFTIPQFFLQVYTPWLDGTAFYIGNFFTPVGEDIGYPLSPPSHFYTHSYALSHNVTHNVGALMAMKLPTSEDSGLLSLEVGVIRGWNTWSDYNDDLTGILNVRWRSRDMRTWWDFESIFGNEQSDEGNTAQRPFAAVSSTGEDLFRVVATTSFTRSFAENRFQAIIEAIVGHQEGGDVEADEHNPPGFLITENSSWYGVNASLLWFPRDDMQVGFRAEWLTDEKGASFLFQPGDYYGLTGSFAWFPVDFVRVRTELRYDWYAGPGSPFADGTEDEQLLGTVDVTVTF